MRRIAWFSLALILGCATVKPVALRASSSHTNPQLLEAADRFYSATDAAQLRAALDEALRVAPYAAIAHELGYQYARLRGDERLAVEHLMIALADTDDADALLHLKLLYDLEWTYGEARRVADLLEALSTAHPSPEVRSYAAFRLITLRRDFGESPDEAEARINGRLPLAIIGPWDNDQGKGFDMPQPPETEGAVFDAEYPGVLRPVRWRRDVPLGPQSVYFLSEVLEPNRFALAYATAAFKLDAPARVELRLRTTEPFKLWVDGALVASVREVKEIMFDQAVVPVDLPAGEHRLSIKSARRDEGGWLLSARITGERGAELEGLHILPPDAKLVPNPLVVKALAEDVLVRSRVAHLEAGRVRSRALTALWWRHASGGMNDVREAEKYAASAKNSVMARWLLTLALWNNGEHGRASDLLAPLTKEVGEQLPAVAASQARLWTQQGLRQKARASLVALNAKHQTLPPVLRELESVYDSEEWLEDECAVRGEYARLLAGNLGATTQYAACLRKMNRHEQAEELYRAQLKLTPGAAWLLSEYMSWALERGRDSTAEWAAREYVQQHPYYRRGHLMLADLLERREAYDEAKLALARAMALAPESAAPWNALARLEYRRGDKQAAVAAWREALARNPDDEKLANRLDFLAPSKHEPWAADVPDEAELERLVEKARSLKPQSGANYAFVLDHEVAEYKPDGTVVAVVTGVLQSFNADGRDALLKQNLGGGRVRIRVAYAVDADGRRIEPASVRDNSIRFRSLGERSTVVFQFRRDTSPRGFLARQLHYSWSFQGVSDQRERAQLILYMPKGIDLHEWLRGKVDRNEREVGELRRIEWTATNVPPAGAEQWMPPVSEVTSSLMLSSVQSWDVFAKWTDALFHDAIRESPEVRELGDRLFQGTTDPNEKLKRIQAWLMKEIRYEQDYESMIAGVKPHPAPMVLERKYGDCKDKTILFMTLAKRAGIETHYALIRTRDWGQVKKELPQQQFNHVIVYVPKQPGIDTDRYFDPTADALDVDTVRPDDVGTQSFVLNPSGGWQWRQVPYQPAESNSSHAKIDVVLSEDGSGVAKLSHSFVGNDASLVRRLARNQEHFDRLLQHYANTFFTGSQLQSKSQPPNPDDVRAPASFALELAARTAAKREGDALRLSLPREMSPAQYFKLSSRKHPLVLSVPKRYRWSGTMKLPNGTLTRAPGAVDFKSTCFDYMRKVTATPEGVEYDHAVETKCERIDPSSYADAFKAAVEVQRLMEEDVVFSLKPAAPVKVKTVTRPAP